MPQGSILGPLFFLVFINDIGENLNSSTRLFADDCVIYREISNQSDRISLQDDLDRLYRWTQLWQLPLNLTKCNSLSITSKSKYSPSHHYRLNDVQLNWVNTFTYLGVKIQRNLKWEEHIKTAAAKASNILNLLKRNMYGCSKDSKVKAYTALVRPHLEFASPVWNPPEQKNITKLEQVQRRAARWITAKWLTDSNKWSKSYDQSKKELHWLSLELRRKYLLLCEVYKIVNKQDSIEFAKYFTWNPCTGSSSHKLSIFCKHARTNTYRYSFFINSIHLWNSLPLDVVKSTSLVSFKHKLKSFLY